MSFLKNLLNMGHHGSGNNSHQQRNKHHGGSQAHGGSRQNDWGNVPGNPNNCASCNFGNAAGARFCQQCGNTLQPKNCGACGVAKIAGAKFCANCGTQQ
ncbi:double zinc ribbon domain-containing protein [Collimonas pratensis]|uniref:Double zinc ribbon family protein n=1 Tax=Collimonas pratensis TaxID=279113 RepID=A0ABN4MBK0_9BURK|nr:zinc ribbon domain-containing protein [Collimonas pratensis]AMP14543.1 double zinc ribbon family protein [Collimonas pratensis]